MPGSAVPIFAVRPLVADDGRRVSATMLWGDRTIPAIADLASHSGLATPRLVVRTLDHYCKYVSSRTDIEARMSPASSLFGACAASVLMPDSFPTTTRSTVRRRSRSFPCPGVPDGSHVGDSVAPAGLKYERGDESRRLHAIPSGKQRSVDNCPVSTAARFPPPTRAPETTPAAAAAAAAAGNPELFWKGGAQTPRQGLLSAFPGLVFLAHAALCPSSPLHQHAMQHYPRLAHHLPQRSGRTGKKKKVRRAWDGSASRSVDIGAPPRVSVYALRDGGVGLCGGVRQPESPSTHSASKHSQRSKSTVRASRCCYILKCCPSGSACHCLLLTRMSRSSSLRGKMEGGSAVNSWETLCSCDQRGRIVQGCDVEWC
ncbi:hypothetical protein B0T18DRAFT_70171 [Schizothecium vesticola]|uniref:Uncharacterized protein n=1 Tax=Schizothecium vesticola TaxID=314040 RepID=A0AA40F5G9_9PEZI|nr:hypothetical protein B0T18DRAFT_70171 [Schizothecium vesticola]